MAKSQPSSIIKGFEKSDSAIRFGSCFESINGRPLLIISEKYLKPNHKFIIPDTYCYAKISLYIDAIIFASIYMQLLLCQHNSKYFIFDLYTLDVEFNEVNV